MQSYSPFDNSRYTAKITAEIMRGMIWCQCFCLLMGKELRFLSVSSFLVWPWPWQLKQISEADEASAPPVLLYLWAVHTIQPYSSLIPLFSLLPASTVFTSATVWRIWVTFDLFSSRLFSLSIFPSSFSSWIPNYELSFSISPWLHLPLLHVQQYLWLFFLSSH